MSKDTTVKLELTPTDANALMVMIEADMEATFTYGSIDPINEWEQIDLYAYKLLAYQKYKTWYQSRHGIRRMQNDYYNYYNRAIYVR